MSEKNSLQEYCQKEKIAMPVYNSWSIGPDHQKKWSASVSLMVNGKKIIVDTIESTISKIGAEKQAAMLMLDLVKSKKTPNKILGTTKMRTSENREPCSRLSRSPEEVLFQNFSRTVSLVKRVEPAVWNHEHNSKYSLDLDNDENPKSCASKTGGDDDDIYILDDNNDIICIENMQTIRPEPRFSVARSIYLLDLENKPMFKKNNFKTESVYIGFLNSIHHSVEKYSDWHKCKSDRLVDEINSSDDNKLLYLVDGGTADLVDHFITALIYPIIDYIKQLNTKPTIYIISGDHAGWCTRACFEKILKWHSIEVDIINSPTI